jgi:heterodisulfide reductase subunit A-like polyferredoxin
MYEKNGRYIVDFPDIPKARQHQIEIDVEERRGNYNEVELGFDEQRALQEARRCLSCRRCLGCALCWAECKPEAINFEMEDEVFDLEADSVIISPGVERPLSRLDKRFGFGKHLNVITDTQLERMLSRTGPSAGLVIRPYDGELPASIAFVQSYGAASPVMHHAALCFAVNGAISVRSKLPRAEIEIFAANLESFKKEQEAALAKLDRIGFEELTVNGIEAADNQSLILTVGSNGSEQKKTFDLVVLITQPQISRDVKQLTKGLGLSVDYANFLIEGGTGLISTDKEPVRLAAQG